MSSTEGLFPVSDRGGNALGVLIAADGGGGSAIGPLIPLLLIFAAFYLLILRPQRNRARQARQIQNALHVGAEVMTTAGLFARVAEVRDDSVVLEVAPGVTNRYVKGAIARVVSEPPPGDDAVVVDERAD